jgi:uncharacterized membrane protein
MPDGEQFAMILFRWLHFLAGITWIGLLYYLNLINVRFVPSIEASLRPQIVPLNLARVLAWFRHSAWVTVLMGLLLIYMGHWRTGDIITSDPAKTILTGGVLGIIMALNVWVFIWPNQKKILAAMRAATAPDPSWGRTALYASRANFTMSFPMLWFMGSASHYPMDWTGIAVAFVLTAAIALLVWNYVQRWAPSRF